MLKFSFLKGSLGYLPAWAVLIAISFVVPLFGFWVVDCGSRYLQMINIADHRSFQHFWIDYPFKQHDPTGLLNPIGRFQGFRHNDRFFVQYPPAFAYLSALVYKVIGNGTVRVVPVASGMLLLAALARLAMLLQFRKPFLVAAMIFFGSPLLPYAYTFWDILPAIALSTWSLVAALQGLRRDSPGYVATSALLSGGAFILREEYMVWGVSLLIGICVSAGARKPPITFAAVFGGLFVMVAALNQLLIGKPLFSLIWLSSGDPNLSWSLSTRYATAYRYIANVTLEPMLDWILFGGLACLGFIFRVSDRKRLALIAVALISALIVRYFSWNPEKPLFRYLSITSMAAATPLIFLGTSPSMMTTNQSWRLLWVSSSAFLLFSIITSPPVSSVGFHFGPRLLLPAYPGLLMCACFLFLEIAKARQSIMEKAIIVLLLCLFGLGLIDSALYINSLRIKATLSGSLLRVMESTAPSPILTNVDWIGMEVTPLWYSRTIIGIIRTEQKKPGVELARKISPQGAVLIAYGAVPPEVSEQAFATPLPAAEAIKFPDATFSFKGYLLKWK